MIVVPFEAAHLKQLGIQQSQEVFRPMMLKDEYGISLEKGGPAFSAFVDGEIIAALGIIPQWENRAMAWGLIGGNARRHFVPLTKAIMRFLEVTPHRRVETAVDSDFPEGHRWARLLGFENEGRMRAYTPDGRDCNLYARVK